MNYLAFSIVIIGLIIGCIFYDELYNKNIENFPGWAIGILIFTILMIPFIIAGILESSERLFFGD